MVRDRSLASPSFGKGCCKFGAAHADALVRCLRRDFQPAGQVPAGQVRHQCYLRIHCRSCGGAGSHHGPNQGVLRREMKRGQLLPDRPRSSIRRQIVLQVIYTESMSNPTLVVSDIPALAKIAHDEVRADNHAAWCCLVIQLHSNPQGVGAAGHQACGGQHVLAGGTVAGSPRCRCCGPQPHQVRVWRLGRHCWRVSSRPCTPTAVNLVTVVFERGRSPHPC